MAEDYEITVVEDKPLTGMWHCGPNPCWITVTHKPTMISARAYGRYQHKLREAAMTCVELMVEASGYEACQFPEGLQMREARDVRS